jgi:hypothetical protein
MKHPSILWTDAFSNSKSDFHTEVVRTVKRPKGRDPKPALQHLGGFYVARLPGERAQ